MGKSNKIGKEDDMDKTSVKERYETSENPVRIQYDKLSEDWRQFNNILWGIPSVAVSIMAGVIVVAYQPELDGAPRHISLVVGSLFLFALTLEVANKRLFMDITEVKLKNLQKSKA